jgi:hypothetical protein
MISSAPEAPQTETPTKSALPSLDLFVESCGDVENGPEQYVKPNEMVCPWAMTLELRDWASGFLHLFETHCKRWSCSACGPAKTKELCARIETAQPNRLLTLTTTRHKTQTPREVFDRSRRQVPELVRWIRKEFGAIEYCRVVEETKTGYPHYHLVVRSTYLDQKALSAHWATLTEAFIVDIRKIDPGREVARYIAKYLTKQPRMTFTNRRVTQSRNFFPKIEKKEETESDWEAQGRHHGDIHCVAAREFPHRTFEVVDPYHWILDAADESF